jgi:hypothetical protein
LLSSPICLRLKEENSADSDAIIVLGFPLTFHVRKRDVKPGDGRGKIGG